MGVNKEISIEQKEPEMVIEPFSGKVVRVVDDFKPEPTSSKSVSLQSSIARTKRMISDYSRCAVWEWFVTLTFAPDKADRTNFKECMAKVRNWLNNARKRFAPDLKYLVVPELHKDNVSWHVHMLLANTGSMKFVDSGHKKSGYTIYNLSGWRFGFSTATKIRETLRVRTYILKYITKESCVLAYGAHRYYASHNLPKPKVTSYFIPEDEQWGMIQSICDKLELSSGWVSHSSGDYTDTTYIELE